MGADEDAGNDKADERRDIHPVEQEYHEGGHAENQHKQFQNFIFVHSGFSPSLPPHEFFDLHGNENDRGQDNRYRQISRRKRLRMEDRVQKR
jgi:hypothetical protein